jgi:RluA family pseudouridine synthase
MKSINPERILYEDEHLLVVNKLSGELVVAAEGEGKMPLYDFLHKAYPGLRVVHRLDYGTSGVLVFAKNAEVVKVIREGKFAGWKKRYRMLVAGSMREKFGTIKKELPARTHEGLVEAVTHFKVLQVFKLATYVETDIETGRKHQIRRHMASIGHPLLLDAEYGDSRKDREFKRKFKYRRLFLHAYSLELPHPITGKKLTVMAPIPPSFQEAIHKLQRSGAGKA